MSARHDDALRGYLTRADFLLKDLRSEDPERAYAAAARFCVLDRVAYPDSETVLCRCERIRRNHALDVVAREAGESDWRSLRERAGAPETLVASPGDGLALPAARGSSILDGSFLPNAAVTVLAGQPSHGKSGLALQIARNVAERSGKPVVFFGREAGKKWLLARMLTTEARVDFAEVRRHGAKEIPGAMDRLTAAGDRIASLPLYPTGDVKSIRELVEECDTLSSRQGELGLVVLDYVQLFSLNRTHDTIHSPAAITDALLRLAESHRVAVLVVSALELRTLRDENPRPLIGNLGHWRVLGDRAASVLLVHRPNVHVGLAQNEPGPIRLCLDKHPDGTGHVDATIVPAIRHILQETFSAERDYLSEILPQRSTPV